MADNEKLTPEEEDVRNQVMLQDLRSMHAPIDEAQSLERVRARLLATERTSTINSIQIYGQFMRKTKQGRIQSMHDMPISIAHKKGHYLNMLAAGVVAALLIGSLLFAVTRVYQNNIGGGGPVTPQVPISKATPTSEPTFSGGPGWKHVVTFRGTGSTTITKLHLKFPYAVGSFLVCTGEGDIYVSYNKSGTIGFGSSCHSIAKGEFIEWEGAYVLEMISIAINKNSSWELQLENCVDKSICGSSSKTITPTPVSTSIPFPTPTQAPGSIPTPAPTIMPIPTVAPGLIPTPTPMPIPTPTPAPSH